MIRAKNSFYRKLKLDDATKNVIKFYRNIKEVMLKNVDCTQTKQEEKENNGNPTT